MRRLSLRQEKFCLCYRSNGGNATQAYAEAYGVAPDIKARVAGSRNVTKSNIKRRLEELMKDYREEKNDICQSAVMKLQTALDEAKTGRDITQLSRTLLEVCGALGVNKGSTQAVQVNIGSGGIERGFDKMGMFDLMRIQKVVEEQIALRSSQLTAINDH